MVELRPSKAFKGTAKCMPKDAHTLAKFLGADSESELRQDGDSKKNMAKGKCQQNAASALFLLFPFLSPSCSSLLLPHSRSSFLSP